MADKTPSLSAIRDEQLADALSKRYLEYALSSIVSRSLPDVRDGLKPVHRRLLYAMRQLKLNPTSGFKKCARVVGDVIGKYHPHGDVAVYDAMVRLSQSFSVRYPLVDGQGNFGNIDGDSHAAMRYTEARLTLAGDALMDGLDEDTVDFASTYDGTDSEPMLMPASFPNLLANGTQGIAVGMATNVPPHNLEELAHALIYVLDHKDASVADLIQFIPGPDFPTGGVLLNDKEAILKSYETGRGSFTLRSKWEKEDLQYGNYQIVITEIPFGIQKSRLIEKIASLIEDKKLPMVTDIRDESAEDIRVVIEPKNRSMDPAMIMGHLFKLSDFQVLFHLNMNVLDATRTPREMSLLEVLQAYIDHRQNVLQRRSQFRLGNINHRLEVLEGLLKAYLNLDEVIRIIRENDEPKPLLIAAFDLTDLQADSILNMRLRSLRKLEEMSIKKEDSDLRAEKEKLEDLLGDPKKQFNTLKTEFKSLITTFGKKTDIGARRTLLVDSFETPAVSDLDAFIEKEPLTILVSNRGWIRSMKGHQDLSQDFTFKDGDSQKFALHCQTTDKLILVSTSGRFFTLDANTLPGGRGFGEPLRMMVDLDNDSDFTNLFIYDENASLLCVADNGYGFRVKASDVMAQTRSGKTVMNLVDGSKCFGVYTLADTDDHIAIIGNHRKLLVFKTEEIPFVSRGKGVILQKFRDEQTQVADILPFPGSEGLYWETGRGRTALQDFRLWLSKRASVGRTPPTGFPRKNQFIG
ncbi:MAG: DNA topoisomerase IV subunit A [Alphaproteobacteria bacterium]|nr:DNA topoisomerase IV subunit A [Alphaproteobacteria bacterium]MBN2779546.1 DNA topoisomerase IV subunit A [Alphaproteobacteria bacterium]